MLSLANFSKLLLDGQMVQGELRCWFSLPTSILPVSPWHTILAHFLPCELAHLCAMCFKDSLMRLTSSIPVLITDCTPLGYRLHQVKFYVSSHLSRTANTWLLLSNLARGLKIWLKNWSSLEVKAYVLNVLGLPLASLWMNEYILTTVAASGSFAYATFRAQIILLTPFSLFPCFQKR